MSNRKENIKKTLGISEYPWSSDDDDDTPAVQLRTEPAEVVVGGSCSGQIRVGMSSAGPNGSHVWSFQPREDDASLTVQRNRDDMSLNFMPRPSLRPSIGLRPSYYSARGMHRSGAAQNSRARVLRDTERAIWCEQADRQMLTRMLSPEQSDMARQPLANPGYLDSALVSALQGLQANPSSAPTNGNELDVEAEVTEEVDGGSAPQDSSAMSLEEEVVEIDAEPEAAPQPEPQAPTDPQQTAPNEEPTPTTSSAAEPQIQPPQPQGVKRKRESDDDTTEITSVKEFNQSLLRLLECPVCLEWMEPPMWQCRRGHLVCGRCRARLAACPVCRTAFSSVRNRAMEGVAEMIRYPCRHGCGRDLQLRRRGTHEASCAARRYLCPAPACDQRPPFPLQDLTAHIQSKHLHMVKVGRKHKFSIKVNSEQHDNWIISTLHQVFHLRVDVDIRTWGVVVYVAYIGPKCNAADYTYEVTVTGQHNSRKIVYTRATHCDLECSTLNVSRQDCFHLTLDQALNFLRVKNRHCEPDKYLNFNVEIASNTSQEDSDS